MISVAGHQGLSANRRGRRDPEVVVPDRDAPCSRSGPQSRPRIQIRIIDQEGKERRPLTFRLGDPAAAPPSAHVTCPQLGDRDDADRKDCRPDPCDFAIVPVRVPLGPFLQPQEMADEARVTDEGFAARVHSEEWVRR
jgi:hypothetical protein